MKKIVIALLVIITIILAAMAISSAVAEEFTPVAATERNIEIESRNDCVIGVYYDANVEIDRDDASKLNGDVYVKSAPANGNLGTNRYQRNPRFANGSMNQFTFSGTWVEQEAYIAFNGDAQALIEATLVESSRDGYMSHRLWNRHARPVAVPVFEGNIGGRSIRVSFIEKENIRYYGLELLEQTVNTVRQQPIVTPTIEEQPPVVQPTIEEQEPELPEQPQEPQEPQQPEQPIVTPTIEEEPVVTVQETPAGEGYTTGTVGGRRR